MSQLETFPPPTESEKHRLKGTIIEFANQHGLEYIDYGSWVALKFTDQITYKRKKKKGADNGEEINRTNRTKKVS